MKKLLLVLTFLSAMQISCAKKEKSCTGKQFSLEGSWQSTGKVEHGVKMSKSTTDHSISILGATPEKTLITFSQGSMVIYDTSTTTKKTLAVRSYTYSEESNLHVSKFDDFFYPLFLNAYHDNPQQCKDEISQISLIFAGNANDSYLVYYQRQ